jgi:hypothetical protein
MTVIRQVLSRELIVSACCIAFLFPSCAGVRQAKSPEEGVLLRTVEQRWLHHESVLVRILEGHKFDQEEFVRAIQFFEETTGIPSRDSKTFVGRVPNKLLAEDLERWRAWYAENKGSLFVDPSTGRVLVDENARQPPSDG